MKSRHTSIQVNRSEVEELQRIIREFDQMAADLELQIKIEEDRTRVSDQSHFSYSTLISVPVCKTDPLSLRSRATTSSSPDASKAAVPEISRGA